MQVQTTVSKTTSVAGNIPGPRPLPGIGNLHQIDTTSPVASMMKLAEQFGPIFKLHTPGQRLIVVSSPNIAAEVCDDKRFDKHVHNVLRQIREFAGDGLFTVGTSENNWKSAHRVVTPAFSANSLNGYFDSISEIADQLVGKWERLGSGQPIQVCDAMIRFSLDSVALSTLGFRFNSFGETGFHPFVQAMAENLREAWLRARRPALLNAFHFRRNRKFACHTDTIRRLAKEILENRRREMAGIAEPPADLLGRLLAAASSGEHSISEENVINQIITVLIAGHDTTGSLLAFALHALLSHPAELDRAVAEVDVVVGAAKLRPDHLPRLTFLEMVIRESLRLWPSARTFARKSRTGDTVIDERFAINASDVILVLLSKLHRDPIAWGEAAEEFAPERMEKNRLTKLQQSAFRPFGAGQRSCVGAAFAMRESVLVLAKILQKFSLRTYKPESPLIVRETPALRPAEFQIYASPRAGISAPPEQRGGSHGN